MRPQIGLGREFCRDVTAFWGICVLHWHHSEPFSHVQDFKFRVNVEVISPIVLLATGICSSGDTGASFGTTKPNMISGKNA